MWWAIREDVKEWVLANWWRWREEKPEWQTEVWLAKNSPQVMKTKRNSRRSERVLGGGAARGRR